MPGLSHWAHPRSSDTSRRNGDLSSVLGDFASTGLGVLGLAWQSSPALTEVEEVATDWLRQMLGLSAAWSGVIQDTASTSTLVALLCARERASDYSLARGGLQAEAAPLVVYASAHATAPWRRPRSSRDSAATTCGWSRCDADWAHARRMRSSARSPPTARPVACPAPSSPRRARRRRRRSIRSTAIAAIARTARPLAARRRRDGRLRDDSAGVPLDLWSGIEGADSIVVNPHKWLGAAFDCSVYFVRRPEELVRVMSTNPSYLQTAADAVVKNYRDWGLPLGRRFRALKLWFLIREQGVAGLQARLRRDLENARWLADQVRATAGLAGPESGRAADAVRAARAGRARRDEALDRHTLAWCDRINRSGAAYLTPALLDGRWMVRVSIGAIATERQHVEELWHAMQARRRRDARRAGVRRAEARRLRRSRDRHDETGCLMSPPPGRERLLIVEDDAAQRWACRNC